MTLHGAPGVEAAVALTARPRGARAVLTEEGLPGATTYTVSMESASGYQWVAGSYRTGPGSGPVQVELTCPVSPGQIEEVWVTDPAGHQVLSGYV